MKWRECLVRVGWDKLVWGTNFLKDAPCRIPQIASILPNSKPALRPVSGKYCKKCGQYDKLVHPLSLRIFFLIFLTVTMTQCAPLSLGQGSLLRLAQVHPTTWPCCLWSKPTQAKGNSRWAYQLHYLDKDIRPYKVPLLWYSQRALCMVWIIAMGLFCIQGSLDDFMIFQETFINPRYSGGFFRRRGSSPGHNLKKKSFGYISMTLEILAVFWNFNRLSHLTELCVCFLKLLIGGKATPTSTKSGDQRRNYFCSGFYCAFQFSSWVFFTQTFVI